MELLFFIQRSFGGLLNLTSGIFLIIMVSMVLVFISKFVEIKTPFYKKYCDKDEKILCPTYPILLVRFIHYFTSVFFSGYYFIFNGKYDIYYLILYAGLIIHWLVADDCLLSNWEMAFYHTGTETDKYNLGETGLLHPHLRVFMGDWTDYLIFIQICLMTASFILVIHRLKSRYYPFLFGMTILFLQMWLVLKDRIWPIK